MAAKGLFISQTGQGFTVRGVNNKFFPDNATLAYPANSVILITDDSDMATFRSASNYDVLFSALIKDIDINGERVTKDNIIEAFNEAANKPMSGGGDITGLFADAAYDERQKKIEFYDKDGNEVASIDATDFIKDGMVSNVEISNGNLVITFNTDSGKQPITIPLTDIFNPNNYYNKTESDSRFATQTVVNEEIASRIQAIRDVNTALEGKADKSDTYTKSQIDALIPDTSDFVTKAEYNPKEVAIAEALTNLNENKADKTEIPDVSTFATKSEVDAAKAYYIDFDTIATTGIRDEDWDGMVAAINAHRPIYAGLGNRYYTAECLYQDGSNIIRMTASDELSHYFYMFTKRGTNDYTMTYEVRPYVTEVEKHNWSAKQDALVSGTNIKTINNESILGEGNITIEASGGGMDEDTELLISSALVDLNDRKIDADEVKENYQKKGDYATNSDLALKANSADVPTLTDYDEAQKITSWSLNELNARIAALEEAMGGMKIVKITQSAYDALATKDANTLYVIYSETSTGGN